MTANYIVFDVGNHLCNFQNYIQSPNLPTIDEDAVLAILIDCLRIKNSVNDQFFLIEDEMVNGMLFSSKLMYEDLSEFGIYSGEESMVRQDLIKAAGLAIEIGKEIFRQAVILKLYENEHFNYEYYRTINPRIIILTRIGFDRPCFG